MHIRTRKGSAYTHKKGPRITRRPFIFVVCPFAAVRAIRGLEPLRGGQKPGTPVNG